MVSTIMLEAVFLYTFAPRILGALDPSVNSVSISLSKKPGFCCSKTKLTFSITWALRAGSKTVQNLSRIRLIHSTLSL